jgi:uncharacterized protein YjiS (DUF1127 family)
MSVTTYKIVAEPRPHTIFRTLRHQFFAYFERRHTIQALKSCSSRNLRDVGMIPQDIVELQHAASPDAAGALSATSKQRAANW